MRIHGLVGRVAAVVLAAGMLSSCHGAPGMSNGSVSVCFRAIPVAKAAVHDRKASLIGVHRLTEDSIRDHLPAPARAEMARENDTVVCAVSFKGAFAPGQVDMAPAEQSGPYAVVLLTSRHLHLIAAVVLDKLPSRLGKRTI